MKTSLLFFASCLALAAAESPSVFDVKSFGATGDGKSLDTASLQKTIDACAAAGGGTVYFPRGRFLTGTLNLKSRVTLDLSPGAVLLGSTRLDDYAKGKHLIQADGVEKIAIVGGGTIDGQGDAFFDKDMKPLDRPSQMIEIDNSRDVRVEGITIRLAPDWTLRPRNCDGVIIRGIALLNNLRAVNTDGIDVDCDRNVIISDCHIEAGDDCIVLKTDDAKGEGATENVVVTNCVLVSAASALKLGTGSHRDFRHCVFSNIVIRDSRTGIALMCKDGGTMEDIRFSNITMTTLPKWGQGLEWPIVVDLEKRTDESKLGAIRDVAFNGITVCSKGRIVVEGLPGRPIEGISFRDVTVRVGGYEKIEGAKKPRGGAHGAADNMPDYGAAPGAFVFAHVKGLDLDGITLTWPETKDAPARHAVYGDHLDGVVIAGFHGAASRPDVKAFNLENSKDVKP